MFRKKSLSDGLFLHFSSKVQNLTVFSIVYMIRIRFFGPRELIQRYFSAAQCSEGTDSLVEALGGFELVITHRDGRKLLINNSPGEVVQPMMQGFDLFQDNEGKMELER